MNANNINIYDVASKAQLSVVTVSRVINNSPNVREYNKKKVLRAMNELGYNPSAAARSLAKGKTGIIGLLILSLNDTFFNNVVRSVNESLAANGYFLTISLMEDSDNVDGEVNNYLFQEKRVDGIIILTPINEKRYVDELMKKGIPFILMDNQENYSPISILVNNYKGGCDATMHLLNLGHRKISYISAPEIYLSSREREKGLLDTLAAAELKPYGLEQGGFSISSGYEITKKWISDGRIPTAIFAADDFMALGAIDALKESGLKVPKDVSVCGYDDDFLSSQIHPTLTTVSQPANKMGEIGVKTLLQIIQGKQIKSSVIRLDPELIVRQSTSVPRYWD